jgi:hypothetical protein
MIISQIHYKKIIMQDLLLCQNFGQEIVRPRFDCFHFKLHVRNKHRFALAILTFMITGQVPKINNRSFETTARKEQLFYFFEKFFFKVWTRLKHPPLLIVDSTGKNVRWQFNDFFIFEESAAVRPFIIQSSGGNVRFAIKSPSPHATRFLFHSFGVSIQNKFKN